MFQSFVPGVVHQLSEQSGGKIGKLPVFAFMPSGPTAIIQCVISLASAQYCNTADITATSPRRKKVASSTVSHALSRRR